MLAFALTDASLPVSSAIAVSRYKARFNWDHYPHPMIPGARESLPDETHGCASVTSAFLQVRIASPPPDHTPASFRAQISRFFRDHQLSFQMAAKSRGGDRDVRRARRSNSVRITLRVRPCTSRHTKLEPPRSIHARPLAHPRAATSRARAPDEHRAQRTRSAVPNNTREPTPASIFFVCEGKSQTTPPHADHPPHTPNPSTHVHRSSRRSTPPSYPETTAAATSSSSSPLTPAARKSSR